MDLSIVFLIAIIATCLAALRRLAPDRPPFLLQGMFRYEADLGWPHGVQEEDGERAWVPRIAPDWDPEEDELAWAALYVTSTMSDQDGGRPPDPVPVVRVHGDTSSAPRRVYPTASSGFGSG